VVFEGNTIELAGSGVKQAVKNGEAVEVLTGADTGFTMKPGSPVASAR
jgi:hypothetical protein